MSMYEHINGVTKATYDSSVWSNSSVTCKDCIYFNSTEHLKPEWTGSNKCDKHQADGYQEYVGKDSEICEDFEKNDL